MPSIPSVSCGRASSCAAAAKATDQRRDDSAEDVPPVLTRDKRCLSLHHPVCVLTGKVLQGIFW